MKNTLEKSIIIDSTPEKVWEVLTTDSHIRKRCAPFSEGTHAVTDRKEWSDITRLVWDECCVKGKLTTSELYHKIVNTFYEGNSKDGFTDVLQESIESYEILKDGNKVRLEIISWPLSEKEWQECWTMMNDMWDKAVVIIKELSEK